jgi:hypothetical protein
MPGGIGRRSDETITGRFHINWIKIVTWRTDGRTAEFSRAMEYNQNNDTENHKNHTHGNPNDETNV